MKPTRILFIGLILGTAGFLGLFIYFVGGVSAVYDPLKTYNYSLTRDELKERLIQAIKSKSNLTFNLTDSTGTETNDLNYYADILFKTETEEYEFNIKYNKENSFWDKDVKSKISLIGAFDKVHLTGGYKIEDKDVEKLIGLFEARVINELEKNTSR